MAAKKIAFDQEAREAIYRGVKKLARAVKVTLGPRPQRRLEKSFGSPTVTKDGVTVAKEIELEDAYENMGAQMVKEVACKTSTVAGDGTTTATVYAEAIFGEGLKNVASGANPTQIQKGINLAVEAIVDELKKMSKKVESSQGSRPGRHQLGQSGRADRQDDRRRDGQGRQGRRHHRRRGQGAWTPPSNSSKACSSTRDISPRTSSPTRPPPRPVLDDAYILIHEKKISIRPRPGADPEQGRRSGQADADHRRRNRRRSPRDPGREQAARHAQGVPR